MIVRHSKFASNPFGDGGSKRSAQIEELLKSGSLKYENNDFLLPKGLSKFQLFRLSNLVFSTPAVFSTTSKLMRPYSSSRDATST